MKTTIRLSGPPDVLTVLPYQLGFHPRDCLVAVSLHGSRMGMVQRLDLPAPAHVQDAVAAMIAPLLREKPTAVLLVGYEVHKGDSRAMLDELGEACRDNGVAVKDRMVVRDGRWFDLDCRQSCCPPEGLRLPPAREVPAVAEYVGREICPLPDRSALADLLEPTVAISGAVSLLADEWLALRHEAMDAEASEQDESDAERATWEAEPATWQERATGGDLQKFRASELEVWSRVLCDQDDAEPIHALPVQDLAILAASLTDVDLRDGLIAWLCPGTLPPELIDPDLFVQLCEALPDHLGLVGEADGLDRADVRGGRRDRGGRHRGHLDLWDVDRREREQVIGQQRIERRLCELCAALPDTWVVSTLTVLASFTWWRGDGALTRVALDRALRVDPHYRLARLLEQMVDLAIRPTGSSA